MRTISADPVLEQVMLRPAAAPPSTYRLDPPDQKRAKEAMDALMRLWQDWGLNGTGFQSDSPRPIPELRVKARI